MKRTGSRYSRVGPAVTSTVRPASGALAEQRTAAATMPPLPPAARRRRRRRQQPRGRPHQAVARLVPQRRHVVLRPGVVPHGHVHRRAPEGRGRGRPAAPSSPRRWPCRRGCAPAGRPWPAPPRTVPPSAPDPGGRSPASLAGSKWSVSTGCPTRDWKVSGVTKAAWPRPSSPPAPRQTPGAARAPARTPCRPRCRRRRPPPRGGHPRRCCPWTQGVPLGWPLRNFAPLPRARVSFTGRTTPADAAAVAGRSTCGAARTSPGGR